MVNNRSLKCYKLKFKLLGPDAACHTFSLDWEKLHRERLGTRKFNQPLKKKKKKKKKKKTKKNQKKKKKKKIKIKKTFKKKKKKKKKKKTPTLSTLSLRVINTLENNHLSTPKHTF